MIDISINKVKKSRIDSIDFDDLKFGVEFSDHMFLAEYIDGKWQNAKVMPFQDLSFSPASCIFHYGQAVFEGMKAYRTAKGEVLLFRPDKNQQRLNQSAQRMCMEEVPESLFMDGLRKLIQTDKDWVPEGEGKSLYIRPFIIADQNFLGVKASNNYKFIIITSPVANYYNGAIKVKVETEYVRAASGGVGAAKTAGNYAASLYPAKKAKEEGFDQLIWTDAKEHKYIEESGTMNLMLRIGDKLVTPTTDCGSILEGITRDSIIQLAKKWGYEIEERKVSVEEIIVALKAGKLREAFGMGTAATITPISSIYHDGKSYELSDFRDWEFANKTKAELEGIKSGLIEDTFGWTEII